MIRTGRFNDFCHEFIQIHNEDQEDKTLWEYYLHRVFDQSFNDFKASVTVHDQTTTQEDITTTIADSREMLNGFCLS